MQAGLLLSFHRGQEPGFPAAALLLLPSRVLCFQPCEKSIQLALAASLISSSQFPNKLLVNIIEA